MHVGGKTGLSGLIPQKARAAQMIKKVITGYARKVPEHIVHHRPITHGAQRVRVQGC